MATLREDVSLTSISSNKPPSASVRFARGFKKASPYAKSWKAYVLFEDAMNRAERKLLALKRKTDAQSMSAETNAEEVTTESFH